MDQLLQQLVNGVLIGLVYSLLAIGLTLVWGVMNVLNFAHGDFLMIGMFLSYWMYALGGIDPLFSIPVNAVALFLMGMFIYRFIISKVMHGPGLAQLVVTFGVSIFIANFAALIWTPNFRSIEHTLLSGTWDLSGIKLSIPKFVSSIGSVVTSGLLFSFLRYTRTGKAILAVEMDREAATIMGINTERINSLSFAIGSALVGVAGALLGDALLHLPLRGRDLRPDLLLHRGARRVRQHRGGLHRGHPGGGGPDAGRLHLRPGLQAGHRVRHVPDHGLDPAAGPEGVVECMT